MRTEDWITLSVLLVTLSFGAGYLLGSCLISRWWEAKIAQKGYGRFGPKDKTFRFNDGKEAHE